jgi:hypothetical protein
MSLHPTSMRAYFFGDAPTAVVLAVFEPVMTLQKRFSHSLASTLSHQAAPWEEGRSAPNTVLKKKLVVFLGNPHINPLKKSQNHLQ